MMATVLKDKSKIEDTIVELDRYKRDALMKTWEKVNGCVHEGSKTVCGDR
jgi:structural maintenance of chromosome 2